MRLLKKLQAIVLSLALSATGFAGQTPAGTSAAKTGGNQGGTQSAVPSASELQSMVAPIALYPDALLAQVLAGATYPTQIVEAERWLQGNSGLKGEQLGAAVDKQPWDPSIKGLTQFPSVLEQMSKNLSWTSALGDAYFNDPDAVMRAVQVLRKDASNAGKLKSTPEQTVSNEGQTIIIQPAQPDVVYVPSYSPEYVYGTAVAPYPGYSGWDVAAASMLSFGVGTMVGAAFGGWGWGHWGADWHGGNVTFNNNNFVSRSNTFANRNTRYGNVNRGNIGNRNLAARTGNRASTLPANRFTGNANAANRAGNRAQAQNFGNRSRQSGAASRGFGQSGVGSRGGGNSAFGGMRPGGSSRLDSSRGRSSFGGGRRSGGGGRSVGGGGGGRRGGGGRGRR
jgi:hypothetical protein